MRSLRFTTISLAMFFLASALFAFAFVTSAAAQRIAVLAPIDSKMAAAYADVLATSFSPRAVIVDMSLARSAFDATTPADPFNMNAAEAGIVGAAIGCDFLVLVRSDTIRRTSLDRPEYYESYAAAYLVSTRTGRLVNWSLDKFDAKTPAESEILLRRSVVQRAREVEANLRKALREEPARLPPSRMEELPAEGTPEARSFRAPVPFRRIKPEYTSIAFLFDIAATVEVELDLAADGSILRAEVVRWAGFGLDESVLAAVRSMNWRPAERNGKPLPMRVLLRYNFKKFDK